MCDSEIGKTIMNIIACTERNYKNQVLIRVNYYIMRNNSDNFKIIFFFWAKGRFKFTKIIEIIFYTQSNQIKNRQLNAIEYVLNAYDIRLVFQYSVGVGLNNTYSFEGFNFDIKQIQSKRQEARASRDSCENMSGGRERVFGFDSKGVRWVRKDTMIFTI